MGPSSTTVRMSLRPDPESDPELVERHARELRREIDEQRAVVEAFVRRHSTDPDPEP